MAVHQPPTEELRSALSNIIDKSGLTNEDVESCLDRLSKELGVFPPKSPSLLKRIRPHVIAAAWLCLYRIVPLLLALTFVYQRFGLLYKSSPCLLAQPILHDFATPLLNCSQCQGITTIPEISNISIMEFMKQYAFTLQPVLMKGAASDWPAINLFSYDYFKKLYSEKPDSIENDVQEGQFFAYSSGIRSLNEFMLISSEVAALQKQKWYIGWSTSDPYIGEELRKHVKKPYFLPPKSSLTNIAWIFMGAPGPGASLHVDYVGRHSWQAQLSGKKSWKLVPPPECECYCSRFNVTVHKGDIIVVDTNSWFHETYIHPGEMSITYGTEFA